MALTDEAIDKIKAMIVAGELAPGSRLPKEEILAGQLGLSRSSLREAVRALTAMRILITRQGDGTYVSSLEPQLLLESLSFAADVPHDIAFHLRIVEAVGNPVLSMLLQVLSTRTQRVRIVRGSRTRHALDNAHQDHEQILAALPSRDALLAASAATVHITAVEQWLATSLTDPSSRAAED